MSAAPGLNGHSGEAIGDDVRALLAARAERLKARLVSKADEPTIMVAQFRVGEGQYAIPLGDFRAAVPLKLVTPVPLSPPQVIGILRYQGQVISALSLASLLGIRGWRNDPTVLLVVEAAPGKLIGLDCEEIPKPCPLPLAAIEKARKEGSGPIVELFIPGSIPINLLDLAALFERGGWMHHGH
jgi:chemotaxis signal transduction protein